MKNYILFIFTIFLVIQLPAQHKPNFRAHVKGYNVLFPGIEVAMEFPIAKWPIGKEKRSNLVIVAAPALDFFSYKGNYNGLGLVAELNPKIFLEKGWVYELYGGIGMLNAFLSGITYELQADGSFSEKKAKSNQYLNLKAGFGFGKSIVTSSKNYLVGLRLGIREIRTPGYLIAPEVSLGVSFPLKSKIKEQ